MRAAYKSDIAGIVYRRSEKLVGNQFLIATYAPPYQKAGVVPSLRISACALCVATARELFVIGRATFGGCAVLNADALSRKLLLPQKQTKCRSECAPDIR